MQLIASSMMSLEIEKALSPGKSVLANYSCEMELATRR